MDTLDDQMAKLNDLHSAGVLSTEDLETRKAELLEVYGGGAGAAAPAAPEAPQPYEAEAAPAAYPAEGEAVADGAGGAAAVPQAGAPPQHAAPPQGKGWDGAGYGKGYGQPQGKGYGGYGGYMPWGYGYDPYGAYGGGFGSFGGWGFDWNYGMAGPGKGYGKGYGKGHGGRHSPYARTGPTSSIKLQPVPEGTTPEMLTSLFAPHGEVSSAVVMPGDPIYAYVNFAETKSAEAAAALDHVEINGMTCYIIGKRRVLGRQELGGPSDGIGLFNLPFTTTQEDLEHLLGLYPGFKSVKMILRPDGGFRGYAFAYFDSVENATFAKDNLAGLQLEGNNVDIKFSAMSSEQAARQAGQVGQPVVPATPPSAPQPEAVSEPAEAPEATPAPEEGGEADAAEVEPAEGGVEGEAEADFEPPQPVEPEAEG